MSTQLTPVATQCDTLYLSRSVVRTAIISLTAVVALIAAVFCLVHFRAPATNEQAGTTHFSPQPAYKMPHRQLGYTTQF